MQALPELLHPGIVMTSNQTHIQEQLQRKHEELQQLIVHQQEELRRVSEQLLMARYGLMPSIVVPFNAMGRPQGRPSTEVNHSAPQLEHNQQANLCSIHIEQPIESQSNIHPQSNEIVSYIELASTQNAQDVDHELASSSASSYREQPQLLHATPHDRQPAPPQAQLHPHIHQPNALLRPIEDPGPSSLQGDGRHRSQPSTLAPDVISDSGRNELNLLSYQMAEEPSSEFYPAANL